MLTVRKSEDRGNFDFGWLNATHTFSFGEYYDPKHMHYRHLRVINQDKVQPGGGFPTHPHSDMEIITYIINGTIEHKDSMDNKEQIRAGEVQVMSAGTGVRHSEYNPSDSERLELLQIWILPDQKNHPPRYDQKAFSKESKTNKLKLIVSGDGRDGSLMIHQDTLIYSSCLEAGQSITLKTTPNKYYWVQVIDGPLKVNDLTLKAGDAVSASEETELKFFAEKDAHFLVFELN